MTSLYPSSPKQVPARFTELSVRDEWRAAFVLGSLLLTLLVYLALVVGTAWLLYYLATMPWTRPTRFNGGIFALRILGLFCSGFLFLYLFKGLFKHQGRSGDGTVEITEKDQPQLFAFLRQLCAEIGTPLPHRVFCSHEVNACVFYPSSLLSLIFPRRKHLLIGLGLIQTLNLTELKALLGHELGHFSQSSMRLGTYVYMANKVLFDIVHGRDWLDQFLSDMKAWDERIAIFPNVFAALLGYLRLALGAIYNGVNLLNFSLMRQMEYNADRFAVKVAGSDAVAQLLERCAYADAVWQTLEADLWAAGDHRLYSKDIFAHFDVASAALGRRRKVPQWGSRPTAMGPECFVFTEDSDDARVPDMWSTHPSNYDRERQAKAVYIPGETDPRPAWLLFQHPDTLREAVSRGYYESEHELEATVAFAESAQVQQFLDQEYAETTFDEKYAGFYDDRYLELKDLFCLPTQAHYLGGREALAEIEEIHRSLPAWMQGHQRPQDVDARVYLAHQILAREIGSTAEFDQRYQFHVQAQDMHQKIVAAMHIADQVLHFADSCGGEMSEGAYGNVVAGLHESVSRLDEVSMASMRVRIPPLKNMADGHYLGEFLGLGDLINQFHYRGNVIEGAWIDELLGQLAVVENKLQRLNCKSLGALLAMQDNFVQRWREQAATSRGHRPAVTAKRPWH